LKDRKIIEIIRAAAESKQAVDLKVLDISKASKIVDYLVILSAESVPQARAVEKEIDRQLRGHKVKGFKWEGGINSGWMVLDLGGIVVHVMEQSQREYYNLEELWGKEAIIYHY
jgi:ribosome-associated protein